ncbi:hypothetical protein L1F30_02335 [Simiduia sp. 21SJ11W-1]|uniref:hypothetical protein n=1 Tax=Simiduia sp. 21SJ11W-1 TaxID=2909669 RepID=UPI00209D1FA3|nr:hypothetical protein [Simiduia sp. 21SJ11W-1]UTA48394.1 hypothetical protein L1F30_02335 [Simiduia sp. 21SJ11W-1]
MKAWILQALMLVAFAAPAVAQYNDTPADWKCYNKVGGNWIFGIAPYGCDASAFGSDSHLTTNYPPVIFDTTKNSTTERNRYMQELYGMLLESGEYYMERNKPSASSAEVDAFKHAVLAIAHQESFWSHYRLASQDSRYKMMRGDYGHGHGLMQVDDRWHYLAANQGKGWELVNNIFYSLDEYFTAWQRAPNEWCLSSATNWRDRARAAYSAYNGGPSRICRWTNPDDVWARNDVGFVTKYDEQSWLNYVNASQTDSNIDVVCLANGGSYCPPGAPADTSNWAGKLIETADQKACVFTNDVLHCVEDMRHSACLVNLGTFDANQVLELQSGDTTGVAQQVYDPHNLCADNIAGLAAVGDFISLSQANNLRVTPNGELIKAVPASTQVQVEDIVVYDNVSQNRFYQITYQGSTGYIWAGNQSDYSSWTQTIASADVPYSIPVAGDQVSIVKDAINLRAVPGGTVLGTVPMYAVVPVVDLTVQGTDNLVYLKVTYNGDTGYIYSGQVRPQNTIADWVALQGEAPEFQAPYCPSGSSYDFDLMVCKNGVDAYGPFTSTMTNKCISWGGGSSCTSTVNVTIKDKTLSLQRWAVNWYQSIRGSGDCPDGASRSSSYGNHCVEYSNGSVAHVYGPFGEGQVSNCVAGGGGAACYSNRWSAYAYNAWGN